MPINTSELTMALKRLYRSQKNSFPNNGRVNYFQQFRRIEEHLNEYVHPQVMLGAMAADQNWLTDHGPDHIDTVINRASDLVNKSAALTGKNGVLDPYEIYILLVAVHFHDVGNIHGREEHEQKITEIMRDMGVGIIGEDDFEKRIIRDIASAHGGEIGTDKDTIGNLPPKKENNGTPVRMQLLAAILRFADELADGHERAARFALQLGVIPEHNEVYHVYADRLRSLTIDEGNVRVGFEIDKEALCRDYGKGEPDNIHHVLLVDEIYKRTLKMHLERMYCMRYMRPFINVRQVDVEIGIFKDGYMAQVEAIRYSLEEKGYPDEPNRGIMHICPELRSKTGTKMKRKYEEREI